MRLDPAFSIGDGLFVFRVVIEVRLFAPFASGASDTGEAATSCVGFYRTYGLTAPGLAAAARILERQLAADEELETDDPPGSLVGAQYQLIPANQVPAEHRRNAASEGVHFASGRVYFSDESSEPS